MLQSERTRSSIIERVARLLWLPPSPRLEPGWARPLTEPPPWPDVRPAGFAAAARADVQQRLPAGALSPAAGCVRTSVKRHSSETLLPSLTP